ncbi:MAG TPA: protein kinase [Kofleriaceae bacterium]|nr:protein kinase [Kofleriaceae bacterium]
MLPSTSDGERFDVRGKLGSGGNGVVYRVHDRVRGAEVALKTLTATGGRELYRFKREFRSLVDLAHPNLVTLHELHTYGDEWLFTMELIDGVSFHEHVRPPLRAIDDAFDETAPRSAPKRVLDTLGDLDPVRLRAALYQLCDGLHALHGAGKLHRDIKPSNVLVDKSGRVVILDFGLVTDVEGMHLDRTHDQLAVGTPAYMSPEQVQDRPLTEASDWYSVGVILYEALTARRVFEGRAEDVMRKKTQSDPPPLIGMPGAAGEGTADLVALCKALLARDPIARPTGTQVLAALGREPSPATVRLREQTARVPFVGRADELERLRAALAESRHGGATCFVIGASGMGKTALVRAFLDEVSVDGAAVILEGRCYERETVPYKALDGVIDDLTGWLMHQTPETIERVRPQEVGALGRVFPVIRRVPGLAPTTIGGGGDPVESRRRALQALRKLLAAIAHERPVVVCIDDLQWGDADSATALGELVREPDAPDLLLVCTQRNDAGDRELMEVVSEVADRVTRLELGGMSADDARALWKVLRGGGDADAAVRDASGSPMLLTEIARFAAAGWSAVHSVDDAVRVRFASLPPDARALLCTVAVAARPVSTELMMKAAALDDGNSALAALRMERLVRVRGAAPTTIEPSHDRIREAVLTAMTLAERRNAHAAIAAALSEETGDRELLVEHLLGAGETGAAAEHAEVAAQEAEERLALHRACELYGLALREGTFDNARRGELMARRARTLAATGRLLEAADEYAAAAALATDAREKLGLRRRSAEQLLRSGALEDGAAASSALLASVDVRMPRSWRGTLAALIGERVRLKLRGMKYAPRAERDVDPSRVDRIDTLWSVASGFTFVQPVMMRVLAARMLREALAAGESRRVGMALALELGYLSTGGSRTYEETERLYVRAYALATELGQSDLRGFVLACGGVAAYLRGEFPLARSRLSEGEHLLRESGPDMRWQLDTTEVFQISSLWCLGKLRELTRLHPVYLRAAEEAGNVHLERGLRGWRANVAWLIKDDPATARHQAQLAAPPGADGQFHLHHYYDVYANTMIDLYEGRGAVAAERIERAWKGLASSHLLRIQLVDVEVHYLRAVAAAMTRRDGTACVEHLDKVGTPVARTLAAQARGALARARGDRNGGLSALRIAGELAEQSGMSLHRAVAEMRLGEVEGGPAGEKRAATAVAALRAEGVADVERFASMLSPRQDAVTDRSGSPSRAP